MCSAVVCAKAASRASTIAELTAVGRPAILVPLPIATDDHQAANTREMVKAGGARMIRQEAFQPKELAKQIQVMALNPQSLSNAAHCAFNCGRPDAAKDLADLVESMSGIDLMDVIRVGETAPATARLRARASTAAAGGEKTEEQNAA